MRIEEVIEEYLRFFPSTKKALLLFGPPGVGKTYTVHTVAKKLGYDVVEYNASIKRDKDFLKHLKVVLTSKSITPTVVLLDEVDGMENKNLAQLIDATVKPLILTANNVGKIPPSVRERCTEVYVPPADYKKLREITGTLKPGMKGDIRQSLLVKLGSESYTPKKSWKEKLKKWVISGRIDEEWDINIALAMMENAARWFSGWDLFCFLHLLRACDFWKSFLPINTISPKFKREVVKVMWWEVRKSA